jgi:catecholate siderophore receptor
MKNRSLATSRSRRARRRGTSRLFVLGAAFVASTAAHAWAQQPAREATSLAARSPGAGGGAPAQGGQALRFDIPPGPLGAVVDRFAQITVIRVAFAAEELRDLPSPGVSGALTAEAALDRLLEGTAVGYGFSARDAITLDVRTSEFVQVTARTIVASPTFTQPVRDIPQSIAVIPREVMHAQGATTLRDVLRNVPGITFQAGEGGGGLPGDSFTLRGFDTANGMFIDGVRDPGGYARDAFNLEQVEVVKGPSSSIAGRGVTGGAINQVTKAPTPVAAFRGAIGVGNAGYERGTLDLNQPIGEVDSGAALRLNVMWTDAGVPGRDVVEHSSWGVAPSLAFGLGTPTQVTLKYQHLTQDNVPDYGLPWGTNYPGYETGAFQADPPIDQSNFYGLRDYDYEDIRSDVATVDLSHRFDAPFTLRNTTRYSDTDRDSAITAPRPPRRQLQRRVMGNGNVANQTNLTASLGQGWTRHDLVTGLELSRETTFNQRGAQDANQPPASIEHPDPDERPFGPMPALDRDPAETSLRQAGAYLFDTMHLGERWQITGGARWDVVDVSYEETALATGAVTRVEASDAMVSWRGGVVYKPRPSGSIYAGYGTSFDPSVDAGSTGAALSASPTAEASPNLDPEQTRNYEVGTKWDLLRGRLAVTGAVFRTEKVNARTRNANDEPFVLEGRQRVQGVELGVSGNLTGRWTALAAYALMDTEIVSSADPDEVGGDFTRTPRASFNLWTSVALPGEVTVGGGTQYVDTVFRSAGNTLPVPGYWLFNGMASYEVNEQLTLRLNGQNLTDEAYVDRVGGGHYVPGPRRQILLNLDFGF